jgi:hypothetical protein
MIGKMKDIEKALVHLVMLSRGIVPMINTSHDISRALSQLPPEEALKMRRKFRKLWRAAMRACFAEIPSPGARRSLKKQLALGQARPDRLSRASRKSLVASYVWERDIQPLLDGLARSKDE